MIQHLILFVRERFPLLPSLLAAALMAACADVVGSRLLGRDGVVDVVTAAMAVVVLALLFIVRGVDELRDLHDDRVAHPERPLPRGAVAVVDVVVAVVVVAFVAVAVVGVVVGVIAAVAVAVAVLFTVIVQLDAGITAAAKRPLVTLITHQLMVPAWVLLVVLVRCIASDDITALSASTLPRLWPALLVASGLSLLFELGRKVHHVDDENVLDDSYSRAWGARPAAVIVAVLAMLIMVPVTVVTTRLSTSVWSLLVPGVAVVWVIGSALSFAAAPRRGGGRAIAMSTALASLWVYLPLILGAV